MTDNMPTTRKELCAYINNVLVELQDEANDTCDHASKRTVTIKGNSQFIYYYIEGMCTKYNDRNTLWHCTVENVGESDEYDIYVYDATHDDGFEWQEDDSDEPLVQEEKVESEEEDEGEKEDEEDE